MKPSSEVWCSHYLMVWCRRLAFRVIHSTSKKWGISQLLRDLSLHELADVRQYMYHNLQVSAQHWRIISVVPTSVCDFP